MKGLRTIWPILLAGIMAISSGAAAAVQVPLDRTDPGLAAKALREENKAPPPSRAVPIEPAAPAAASSLPSHGILVGAVRIDGAEHVPMAALMQAVSPFIGHELSPAALQDLLTAVSGVARAHGYILARSSIPPQTLTAGVLHVRLDEGRIDRIETRGARGDTVRAVLSPLLGHAPTGAELERQLMLAEDLPGVRLGRVSYELRDGRGVLIVPVSRNRVSGRATVDNRGLSALGPVRAQLEIDFNGLLGDRDTLTVEGVTTPIQPRELNVIYGRYAYQLNDAGTEIAAYGSYGRTRSGGAWRAYHENGESESFGVSLTQPLLRGRKVSLWLMGGLDHYAIDQHYEGRLVRRDRLTAANLSLNGYAPLAGGRLRAGAGVTQGLDIWDATRSGDPLASRPGAGSDFTLFGAWANWTGDIAGPLSARMAISSQLSTRPLLAIEQITIGGPVFGRGYDYSERAGDEGVLGSAELRWKLVDRNHGLVRWAQLYGFADGGRVTNHRDSYGTGTLYSAGAGARISLAEHFSLDLEAAFPINKDRYDSGDKSPRLSFSLTKSF